MKKKILGFAAAALLTIGLAACGNSGSDSADSSSKEESKTLVVGASPTPHAEILEHVKPLLEKEGVKLEIKKFDDYVLPNKALADGDIDVNYFQHKPFFNKAVKENDYKFSDVGAVHIEPMGLYSKKIKDIKELKNGATIITSNSESDWGRIITILQDADLVKVKEGVDLETATFEDIAENPKELKFEHSIDPALLATTYGNDEGDLVAINANFAYGAGLNPVKDAILLEKDTSPYANILAVRTEDKNDARVKKLVKVLHEKDVQDWILEKWDGSVKPVEK
ncbi:MetQ/NlpA family ABC transporter substrate-binding protein [Enterococcus dongliensis]|uniref:Lipoprotein n=1 Tax=Enterococcus dongliensis TaxID=2559925 RepID=A0AAP5KRG1_9ENTE|nr:MetQ/NlpA family ABC transporter substrate-binding protein [Enterococcus dongliensis]MDT2596802.1 MetQ/NlpA family ABC transporter substrate-binding protein [Enterococcus dongliensis]MDT2603181.1 MetQ/NlpA family ABC transporter substrate-binding protein [Enterococcus dongliensis]MDT2633544.1 MetQ/NlpA family ABC transporter substrate-binding protein [Enterococcus dongliensis]MDT2636082.1 MetQ/NlpA family ABC transporter substrate-binding protein [Enterococcus dongliensis]MDT2639012.1 MetQ/